MVLSSAQSLVQRWASIWRWRTSVVPTRDTEALMWAVFDVGCIHDGTISFSWRAAGPVSLGGGPASCQRLVQFTRVTSVSISTSDTGHLPPIS